MPGLDRPKDKAFHPMRPVATQSMRVDPEASMRDAAASVMADAAALGFIALAIMLFGLTMLYSTSFGMAGATYFKKQLMWGFVGLSGLSAVLFAGYKRVSDLSMFIMGGTAFLLCIADFLCPEVKGAHRWIQIPRIGNIQPSEFAKLAVALFLAKFLSDRARAIETSPFMKVFVMGGVCCAPVIGLVLLGKDLGTTVLLSMLFLLMMYASGIKLRYILPIPALGAPVLILLIKAFDAERWARLTVFRNPEISGSGEGYQLWHSLLALGSGGWFGVGFTESRMKANYLPEAHTDFILSIVGEELGFVSLCVVMLFYSLFILFAVRIASKARTRQGMLLAFGLTAVVAMQAIINIGVVSGAFPTKGMPAPFISYGGSNLVMCLVATGLLLSIAIDAAHPDYHAEWMRRLKERAKSLNPFAAKQRG